MNLRHFINGEFCDPASASWLDNMEPATGKVYAKVAAGNEIDVARAVEAAQAAFPAWADTPINDRARIMERIADGIERRREEFARAESIDNGKPLSLARRVDIPRAEDNFRFFARAITQWHSEAYDMGSRGFNYVLRRPLGVVGLISPWNLPLYLFTWKIAPAIAAGNTAVAKPSEITPMTGYLLGEVLQEAGLPAGVLNIVQGTGPSVGEAIVTHPQVKAISFTGSTKVGRRIAEVTAGDFKKLSLEMGGKNASIIFDDAHYDKALQGTLRAGFTNQGQICLCGSRVLVQDTIYDRFVADLAEGVRKLRIGDPLEEGTDIGAIVSQMQWEKDLAYIELARQEGGKVICGGAKAPAPNARCADGWFLQPTIITGLGPQCRVNQEEIFGPVVTVQSFTDEADAIAKANATPYGLSATLWTNDLTRTHRVAAALETGIVWVNSWMVRDLRTPFGGVKQSGIGREGGFEALQFFTEPKNVYVDLG
ncbi:MAG: aldehyde dehydrogenase [Bacteroidia bacterium]|nr:aldehyde dehydrogenase [Bacteroidia bacterium]